MTKKIPTNTITRNLCDIAAPTGNIYESVVILAKRANQIAIAEKKELTRSLRISRMTGIPWKRFSRTGSR